MVERNLKVQENLNQTVKEGLAVEPNNLNIEKPINLLEDINSSGDE